MKDAETKEMQQDASMFLAPKYRIRGFHYRGSLSKEERKKIAERYVPDQL